MSNLSSREDKLSSAITLTSPGKRRAGAGVPCRRGNLADRGDNADAQFDVGHQADAFLGRLYAGNRLRFTSTLVIGVCVAQTGGRMPSKMIWSAQLAARASLLRTVQVSSGRPNRWRAISGAMAGRSFAA